ncbi:hypothetical protein KI387_016228, partial [Taxus chinensis]
MESCHVSSPQTGTRKPDSAEGGYFHTGIVGTKVRVGRGKPKRPTARKKSQRL